MTLNRWITGVGALLTFGLFPAIGDHEQNSEAPLRTRATLAVRTDSGGRPQIEAGLSAGRRGLFYFDTGSNGNLISPELARRMELVPQLSIRKDGSQARFPDGTPIRTVAVPKLELGGLEYPEEKFALFPHSRFVDVIGKEVDGVIGVLTVSQSAVLLDLAGKSMTIWYPASLTPGERQENGLGPAPAIPMVELGYRFSYGVRVRMNDQHEEELLIDTGAPQTVLSRRAARKLNLSLTGPSRTLRLPFGEGERKTARLESLRIGDQTVRNLEVQVSMQAEDTADTMLGLDVLSQFRVLLEYTDKKLYLVPRRP